MIKQKKLKERVEAIITIFALLICTLTISSRASSGVDYHLTHITCSGEEYSNGNLTFVLEPENGYKMPDKSEVTILVDNGPITRFFYNPIDKGSKYAVNIPGAQGKSVSITAEATRLSSDSSLKSLTYSYPKYSDNEYSVPDFSPETKEYNVTLPIKIADNAFIYVDAEKSDSNALLSGDDYSEGGIRLVNGMGTCTYTVTAEDKSTSQYIIHFAKQQPFMTVYLNGGISQSGDGESAETAVKTFTEAKELLAANGTIMICGQVTVSDAQTWSLADKGTAKLKRGAGYSGNMIKVGGSGALILSNITIDGSGQFANNIISGTPGNNMIQIEESCSVTLDSGAVITGHAAYNTAPYSFCYAAVQNKGTLIMNSGSTIENCYNSKDTGSAAVYTRGQFTMNGGTIKNNNSDNGAGGAVYNSTGTFTMYEGSIQNNSASIGGAISIISGNVNINGGTISQNKALHLTGSGSDTGGGIHIQGGNLNLNSGKISNNSSAQEGGALYVDNGTVNLTGTEISDNTATVGGGIFLSDGTIKFSGGSISHNKATGGSTPYGGGIYQSGGQFTMKNGTSTSPVISGNTALMGGGYQLYGGTASLEGGSIKDNTADNMGGGVFNQNGELNLKGISITGNTAKTSGGGLILYGGTTKAEGALNITENKLSTSAAKSNLYVRTGNTLTVTGSLTGKAGISSQANPSSGSPVTVCTSDGIYTITEKDAAAFTSDKKDYVSSLSGNNIVIRCPKAPVILTTSLADGTVKSSYKANLSVKSEASASWSVTEGLLPDGLSLNGETGVISGTPTKEGTYTFTVKAENSGGFTEKELTIVIKPEPGNIEITEETSPGSPDVSLPQSQKKLEDILLSDDERKARDEGKDIIIKLDVRKVPAPLDPEAMSKIKDTAGGDNVAMYLDISLSKQIGENVPELISQTGQPIRIVITIPEELRKAGRIFYVACVHNGETILLPDLDQNPNTITIETDRFSSYALIYKAETNSSKDENKDKNTDKTDKTDKIDLKKNTGTKVSSSGSPATGDEGIPIGLILLTAFSFTLVIFRIYYYNGKKVSGGIR